MYCDGVTTPTTKASTTVNKTEAAHVNTLLRWLVTGEADAATAYRSAEVLAGRANLALTAGIRPEQVAEAAARDPRLEWGPVPGAVLTLLARCWELEEQDGGWNGGDVVEAVCGWFEAQGLNTTHPARSGPGAGYSEVAEWGYEALAEYAVEYGTTPTAERPAPAISLCISCEGSGHDGPERPEQVCSACCGTGSADPAVVALARAVDADNGHQQHDPAEVASLICEASAEADNRLRAPEPAQALDPAWWEAQGCPATAEVLRSMAEPVAEEWHELAQVVTAEQQRTAAAAPSGPLAHQRSAGTPTQGACGAGYPWPSGVVLTDAPEAVTCPQCMSRRETEAERHNG